MREYFVSTLSMAVQIDQDYMRHYQPFSHRTVYNQAEAIDGVTSMNQDRLNESSSRRQCEGRKQVVVYQLDYTMTDQIT